MTTQQTCATCGSPMPADAVAGQCPSCLIRLALTAPDDLPFDLSQRHFGHYELGRQVGAGGMGVVYEAFRISDGARVAVKLIRNIHSATPSALCRFTVEAEAAARLDHPNIVRIHEIGETNGQPFFSMDYVEGEGLSAKIGADCADLSPKDIARLLAKVARAVHHAHLRGVLHRDLKPANILIDPEGEPRLTDFGLAKLLDQPGAMPLTGSGDATGTPGYMSPEQVQGKNIGCAADVYGLGAVLYALLTGRPPFQGQTALETFKLITQEPPVSPRRLRPSVDRVLETICLKCLEKDPRQRYAAAQALADDLEDFAQGRPIQGRPATVVYRTTQWIKRNPVGSALIASLCVGLAIALALLNVVDAQRRQIQLDRDLAFDDGMEKISQLWRDPSTETVTISARELHILTGRSPLDSRSARYQLTFGITANDSPSSMAQRYARLLGSIQAEMERSLSHKVAFNLRLFKRERTLANGAADVSVVGAANLLRAQQQSDASAVIALAGHAREVVLFSSTNSGAQNLAGLNGKRILLAHHSTTVATWAKAKLFSAGLLARDVRVSSADAMLDPAEMIARVLRSDSDASLAPRQQFERYKHRGLIELARFQETPAVLAARAGLSAEISVALQNAVRTVAAQDSGAEHNFITDPAAIQAALQDLRGAMQWAARFDAGAQP